ncbi:MAG: GspE family protein [Alphaproteobacteria bacterium]|nr:GspE family protein [Alphaproteobacteria bacterium]
MTKKLRDLLFMDLYVRLDKPAQPRYRTPQRDKTNVWIQPLHSDYAEDVERLAAKFRLELNNTEAAFTYDGMRFRLAHSNMANGEVWAVLRKINPTVPKLEGLGYAPHIANYMRNLGRRDGLIVFSGATGHGKTTTCFSLLQEYLNSYGGVGMTVEDPVEYILEGPCGDKGYCYQIQVSNSEDWATPLKRTLRWTPRYLLVGEVRSPAAAEQILRAATTGHLVLTTIHAGSIEDSLLGLLQLAAQNLGGAAKNVLAQALTAAVHQVLGPQGPYIRYIFTEEDNNGDPIRALIREERIGMINTYIERQIARMAQLANATGVNVPNSLKDKR